MPLHPPVKWVSAAAAPLGVASGARRLLSGGRASPHRGKDPSAQIKSKRREAINCQNCAKRGPRSVPKVGRFLGPPPLSLCPVRGSGPVGLVPAGVWAAPVPWHRIAWLRAWLSRAVVPSCREFHGVLRHRRQSARKKPCAACAVSALCLASKNPGKGVHACRCTPLQWMRP